MALDLEQLLAPVEGESPAGEDLEYDNEYMEVMRLIQGTGGGGVVAGGETEHEEPNWKEIKQRSLALLERTRDLRLGMLVSLASLEVDGFPGLADGISYLKGLVEQHWDHFFPMLDVEDNNDPTERVMTLEPLTKPPATFGDTWKFQDRIRKAPLTNSRQLGRFGLREILIAMGELAPAEGEDPPSMAMIEGAFEDTAEEERTAISDAVNASIISFEAMDLAFTEKVGAGSAMDLSSFTRLLKDIKKQLDSQLARLAGEPDPAEGGEFEGDAGGGGGGRPAALSGEITSIDDVNRAIDKIVRFYERAEPSSPVPLVLKRAQSLVGASYMDIVRNLAPDSEHVVRQVIGQDEENV